MKVFCFGSRGSIPSPSRSKDHILGEFSTAKYGGNTTSYYIEAGGYKIIIDGGSGIKELGKYLLQQKVFVSDFIHLFTHYHSDHIQGLGFFPHYYIKGNKFHIHGLIPDHKYENPVEATISKQYEPPNFPVAVKSMPATKIYHAHEPKFSEAFSYVGSSYRPDNEGELRIQTIPLHHPNGCLGYRIDFEGKSFAFCTDNEPLAFPNDKITTIGKDVDLLILDGQYSDKQLAESCQGFGHGSPKTCIEQKEACNAKKLLIHHFDPCSSDQDLDVIASSLPEGVELVREGLVYEI